MLCVANGNFTEGYNLPKELCRGAIVIGIPFLNTNDPEVLMKKLLWKNNPGVFNMWFNRLAKEIVE